MNYFCMLLCKIRLLLAGLGFSHPSKHLIIKQLCTKFFIVISKERKRKLVATINIKHKKQKLK